MNKNFSEEIIEIDGNEYKLFINRTGIVNWEKATKLKETAETIKEKYKDNKDEVVFDDSFDPFSGDFSIDEDEKTLLDAYSKFYWMALYKNHKLTIQEANELFYKAVDEYGINQLAELAQQMIQSANEPNENLKNLKALKSAK